MRRLIVSAHRFPPLPWSGSPRMLRPDVQAKFVKTLVSATGQFGLACNNDPALKKSLEAAGVSVAPGFKLAWAATEAEVKTLKADGRLVLVPKLAVAQAGRRHRHRRGGGQADLRHPHGQCQGLRPRDPRHDHQDRQEDLRPWRVLGVDRPLAVPEMAAGEAGEHRLDLGEHGQGDGFGAFGAEVQAGWSMEPGAAGLRSRGTLGFADLGQEALAQRFRLPWSPQVGRRARPAGAPGPPCPSRRRG